MAFQTVARKEKFPCKDTGANEEDIKYVNHGYVCSEFNSVVGEYKSSSKGENPNREFPLVSKEHSATLLASFLGILSSLVSRCFSCKCHNEKGVVRMRQGGRDRRGTVERPARKRQKENNTSRNNDKLKPKINEKLGYKKNGNLIIQPTTKEDERKSTTMKQNGRHSGTTKQKLRPSTSSKQNETQSSTMKQNLRPSNTTEQNLRQLTSTKQDGKIPRSSTKQEKKLSTTTKQKKRQSLSTTKQDEIHECNESAEMAVETRRTWFDNNTDTTTFSSPARIEKTDQINLGPSGSPSTERNGESFDDSLAQTDSEYHRKYLSVQMEGSGELYKSNLVGKDIAKCKLRHVEGRTRKSTVFDLGGSTCENTNFELNDSTGDITVFDLSDNASDRILYNGGGINSESTGFELDDSTRENTVFDQGGGTRESTVFELDGDGSDRRLFNAGGITSERGVFDLDGSACENRSFNLDGRTSDCIFYNVEFNTTNSTLLDADDSKTECELVDGKRDTRSDILVNVEGNDSPHDIVNADSQKKLVNTEIHSPNCDLYNLEVDSNNGLLHEINDNASEFQLTDEYTSFPDSYGLRETDDNVDEVQSVEIDDSTDIEENIDFGSKEYLNRTFFRKELGTSSRTSELSLERTNGGTANTEEDTFISPNETLFPENSSKSIWNDSEMEEAFGIYNLHAFYSYGLSDPITFSSSPKKSLKYEEIYPTSLQTENLSFIPPNSETEDNQEEPDDPASDPREDDQECIDHVQPKLDHLLKIFIESQGSLKSTNNFKDNLLSEVQCTYNRRHLDNSLLLDLVSEHYSAFKSSKFSDIFSNHLHDLVNGKISLRLLSLMNTEVENDDARLVNRVVADDLKKEEKEWVDLEEEERQRKLLLSSEIFSDLVSDTTSLYKSIVEKKLAQCNM